MNGRRKLGSKAFACAGKGSGPSVAEEDVTPERECSLTEAKSNRSSNSRPGIGYIFPWVLLSQDFMDLTQR